MGQQTDEKMKDHHEDHDEQEDANSAHGQKKKEGEMDKLKDYYHKDEELEEEGETYGGLM
ncbi:hypothetical protein VI817_003308 [Penicillium citrinum]|nr:hypothetical protein VI817_003308 [Penicillium citrinum]